MSTEGGPPGNGRADGSAGIGPTIASPTIGEVEGLVRSLADVLRDGCLTELELAFGAVSVRLRGGGERGAVGNSAISTTVVETVVARVAADEHVVTAPMIGTFYAAPSPGASPFVEVGDAVSAGQVIGIIEAMKIMNEIVADRSGVVSAVLVGDGEPVEYGSALVRLKPGGAD